jgi:hypothetical protein
MGEVISIALPKMEHIKSQITATQEIPQTMQTVKVQLIIKPSKKPSGDSSNASSLLEGVNKKKEKKEKNK